MEISYIDTSQLARSPFQAKVVRVESPTLFWVQLRNGEPALRDLHEELAWWMPRRGKALWPSYLKKGEPVALFHQRRWERGVIKETGGSTTKVKIALPDWGETTWKRPQDLYQLEDRFRDLSWQGLTCRLEGIGPAPGITWWPHNTRQLCRVLMENQDATIEIKMALGPGNCLVTLSLQGGDLNIGPIDLRTTLLRLGHVRATESLAIEAKPCVQ